MAEYDPESKFKYQIITKYIVVETKSGGELEEFDCFDDALDYIHDILKGG